MAPQINLCLIWFHSSRGASTVFASWCCHLMRRRMLRLRSSGDMVARRPFGNPGLINMNYVWSEVPQKHPLPFGINHKSLNFNRIVRPVFCRGWPPLVFVTTNGEGSSTIPAILLMGELVSSSLHSWTLPKITLCWKKVKFNCTWSRLIKWVLSWGRGSELVEYASFFSLIRCPQKNNQS